MYYIFFQETEEYRKRDKVRKKGGAYINNCTPFAKIPNKIILYSCINNHYVLPLYLYSVVNKKYHNNMVDTNIICAHINSPRNSPVPL